MRVLVDALPLRRGGGVTYLAEQLNALAGGHPEAELRTLVSPWAEHPPLPGVVKTVRVRSVALRFAYEQVVLPWANPDVLYCPANFGPVASRSARVLMIHDAHYYRSGLELGFGKRPGERVRLLANHEAIRRADVVVAVSRTLADDAAATLPSAAAKIHAIRCGAPVWPDPAVSIDGLPPSFVLAPVSATAHKRLEDVVRGWARAVATQATPLPLVVVGRVSPEQLRRQVALAGRAARNLHYLGQVRDRRQMRYLYEHATATISMSALESLSLTPLEAGSVGCPLVLSDIPAHREITLGNAVFVPVGDCDALADVMRADVADWHPGSRKWSWPGTWADNADQLMRLFARVLDTGVDVRAGRPT